MPANPRFIAEVKAAMADLPQEVNLLFVDRLAGIFLVDDLGGTGWTDFIDDGAGHPVAGLIVLDANVLQKYTANEWASWKENTPFKPDPAWKLEARIENGCISANDQASILRLVTHERTRLSTPGYR